MQPTFRAVSSLALAVTVAACGHAGSGGRDVALSETQPTSTTTVTSASSPAEIERAHALVISTTACWLGGLWNDAVGESRTTPLDRCGDVLTRVYGAQDRGRLERLRAVEPGEVRDLATRVRAIAQKDPIDSRRTNQIGAMLSAVAAAAHEQMLARRAADRVKMDTTGERDRDQRTDDERAGDADLAATANLSKLFTLNVAELTPEVRAIGLMLATDRMQIAIDLPKHLKVEVVKGAFQTVFDVPPPTEPSDPAKKLPGGEWLAYLSEVSRAAGYPVPREATKLTDREMMAWGGTLQGLANRLRVEAGRMPQNEMKRAAVGVVIRLDNEYQASSAAVLGAGRSAP